ncbi:MAG: transposase, partial [Acetobacteraceae bacterium]|nr:transposase [Acetobacteraceae bacterium]
MSESEFWLSEAPFTRLLPLLPSDTRGVARVDDRRVISGLVHVLQSGCRWRDAPDVYGPRKTPYNRFVRWARTGFGWRCSLRWRRRGPARGTPARSHPRQSPSLRGERKRGADAQAIG